MLVSVSQSARKATALLKSAGFGDVYKPGGWPGRMAGTGPADWGPNKQGIKTMTPPPPAHVLMYSTGVCPDCVMAERLLKAKGVDEIEKVRIDLDPEQRSP